MLIDGDDRLWIKAPLPVSLPTTIAERIAPVAPPVDVPHWGLWEDREGTVWIGTQSGLYRAPAGEREARRHLVVSERDARSPANAVYAFADGTAGGILLGTKAGVFRLVLASGVSRLRLAPGHGSGDRAAAPIVLTDIRVSNREGTTQIRANGLDRIELSYLDYNFSLEYAALTYAHPSSAAYRYQLEGFDRGWVNAGLRRVAMYTNVPPGDYVVSRRDHRPSTASGHAGASGSGSTSPRLTGKRLGFVCCWQRPERLSPRRWCRIAGHGGVR